MALAINAVWPGRAREVGAVADMRVPVALRGRGSSILRADSGRPARIIRRIMQGLHLTADLHGCPAGFHALFDVGALRALCLAAVRAAGLEPVGELFHRFLPPPDAGADAPVGVTGVVLLAESHLAVHTWPELAAVTLDVYVCNFGTDNSARAHALADRLIAAFEPRAGGAPCLAARPADGPTRRSADVKAILLAAGRGERMRPLTDTRPKPLLQLRGKALIEWHLEALARAGVRQVVINTAWLEDRIVAALGDGARYGVQIAYSMEGRDHGGALETAGGLKKALPLLVDGADAGAAFWYVAADVFTPQFTFDALAVQAFERSDELARLWMVPNPPQHPLGDFGMADGLAVAGTDGTRFTWTGIGLFRPAFVDELMGALAPGAPARLRPYLDAAMARGRLGATLYEGPWADVGTPERLAALQAG